METCLTCGGAIFDYQQAIMYSGPLCRCQEAPRIRRRVRDAAAWNGENAFDYRSTCTALRARVKELERGQDMGMLFDLQNHIEQLKEENARLKDKLAEKHTHERCYALHDAILERDSLLKVVDAAREFERNEVVRTGLLTYSEVYLRLKEALRELDGEKKECRHTVSDPVGVTSRCRSCGEMC